MEEYDSEYASQVLKAVKQRGGHRLLARTFEVNGAENLNKSPGDRQRLYIANHQSHADYLYAWLQFHRQGTQMPMIAAGNNLDLKPLQWIGLDFGKLGAFWVDRSKMREGNKMAINEGTKIGGNVASLMHAGNDILVFPEGGRSYNGNVFEKYNSGITKSVLRTSKNIDIVNIAFAYSQRIEEDYFGAISAAKKIPKIGGTLSVIIDAASFASRYLFRPESTVSMNIGKPTPLEKITTGSKDICDEGSALREYSRKEIRQLYSEITNLKK